MPVYNTPQSGGNVIAGQNLTSLIPGDLPLTLFSGTESAALGLKSIAFSRGYSPGASDNGVTFNLSGMPVGMTVDVQVASTNIDADFSSVQTLSPSTTPDVGNAKYTDIGRSAFYRLYISAYSSGAMCIATAER